MITKYFSKVVLRFNPTGAEAKTARLFLNAIPSTMRGQCATDLTLLPPGSPLAPIIKVTFKDKHALEVDPRTVLPAQAREVFERYSRLLKLKDSIQG